MSGIEYRHMDVLQNIEFAIVEAYRADAALHDLDVLDAVEALVRHYHAEEEQRQPPTANLADRSRRVFISAQKMCEWRLGRSPLSAHAGMPGTVIAVPEMVECLRRIRKSVRRWNRDGGRQGYLEFVSQYVL